MTPSSTGASVSFHVHGSGPTEHMNVTVNTGGAPSRTHGFHANEIGKGLAIGGIGSSSDGIVKIEDDMVQDRSHVTRSVPVTREQAQAIKDALDKAVGKEIGYSLINSRLCTDLADSVYKMTVHPGPVGSLFTGQDMQKQSAPAWSAVPGFLGRECGCGMELTTYPKYSPEDAIPRHVPDPSLLKLFGWQVQPNPLENPVNTELNRWRGEHDKRGASPEQGRDDDPLSRIKTQPSSMRKNGSLPHAGNNKTDGSKGPGNNAGKSDKGNSGKTDTPRGKADAGNNKSKGESSGGWGNPPGNQKDNGRRPIVLDLDGDGIEVTELSRSSVFMDAGGDGLLHRTAWAGVGDGVLFFDANDDNQIGEKREFVFTEWDPTAASDLAALRSYFDSNGVGKLTAADKDFARFKVMVTNADGSMTARTLAQLGIREISLLGDATHITLPDGSVITGQSSVMRMNGTTGTVADAVLA